jgi:hypothetical protein
MVIMSAMDGLNSTGAAAGFAAAGAPSPAAGAFWAEAIGTAASKIKIMPKTGIGQSDTTAWAFAAAHLLIPKRSVAAVQEISLCFIMASPDDVHVCL